jgi:hypothetical protein
MYLDLKQYIMNYTSDDSKRTNIQTPQVSESRIGIISATPTITTSTVNKKNNHAEMN